MRIADSLLPEFDHEMANTRKVLAAVPEAKADWKPHQKSMTMGRLASHLAEVARWAGDVLKADAYDVREYKNVEMTTLPQLLHDFDQWVAQVRAQLSQTSDENFLKTWTLKNGDHVIFALPRVAAIRSMIMNHIIHHRGQLTVYLRLNDVAVPGIYGPSADDAGAAGA